MQHSNDHNTESAIAKKDAYFAEHLPCTATIDEALECVYYTSACILKLESRSYTRSGPKRAFFQNHLEFHLRRLDVELAKGFPCQK